MGASASIPKTHAEALERGFTQQQIQTHLDAQSEADAKREEETSQQESRGRQADSASWEARAARGLESSCMPQFSSFGSNASLGSLGGISEVQGAEDDLGLGPSMPTSADGAADWSAAVHALAPKHVAQPVPEAERRRVVIVCDPGPDPDDVKACPAIACRAFRPPAEPLPLAILGRSSGPATRPPRLVSHTVLQVIISATLRHFQGMPVWWRDRVVRVRALCAHPSASVPRANRPAPDG